MSNQTIELKELVIHEATAQELSGELSDENLDRTETSAFFTVIVPVAGRMASRGTK